MSPGGMRNIEAPLSPGAGMCMRDVNFKQIANSSYLAQLAGGVGMYDALSPRSESSNMAHCVCGLPMRQD